MSLFRLASLCFSFALCFFLSVCYAKEKKYTKMNKMREEMLRNQAPSILFIHKRRAGDWINDFYFDFCDVLLATFHWFFASCFIATLWFIIINDRSFSFEDLIPAPLSYSLPIPIRVCISHIFYQVLSVFMCLLFFASSLFSWFFTVVLHLYRFSFSWRRGEWIVDEKYHHHHQHHWIMA